MKNSAIISYMSVALLSAIGSAHAAQPLRLCADPTNAPFSTQSAEAAKAGLPGLYVEIGQSVAEALGRPFEVVWSLSYFGKRNLGATLLANQCDFAVGLPAVDDFMGPRVVFSKPILEVGYAIVVKGDRTIASIHDFAGQRVAVQFESPPQSLLATASDVTMATVMNPEDGMAKLVNGQVDAAFIWGPTAGFTNHVALNDAYRVIPVDGAQMHWPAAIGFSKKNGALRDQVDAVLPGLAPRIATLSVKYAIPAGKLVQLGAAVPSSQDAAPHVMLAAATETVVATAGAVAAAPSSSPAPSAEMIAQGREIFNGTCSHCHGPDAIQSVRKINLRLLKHRYPDDMSTVFHNTVTQGRPAKGMPAWEGVFTEDDFTKIYAFLQSVQEAQ